MLPKWDGGLNWWGCCFLMHFPLKHKEQEAAYSGIQSRLLED